MRKKMKEITSKELANGQIGELERQFYKIKIRRSNGFKRIY
jgi:hypothetical protein